ncbi:MAG: zf-HC2 domain-containing protein [Pseudomonadota bacterium]|nr:zf-HC2 domain-containing protein [Pseudomonadota bacterium]MEE3319607.1 zf-HC2 domain-containing protein [Pseudomonadota bacterium]
MLKCKEAVEKANALVDGAPLGWRERFALRLHLLMCHHCRRYLRQLRALVISLHRSPPNAASDEAVKHVMDKLDSNP